MRVGLLLAFGYGLQHRTEPRSSRPRTKHLATLKAEANAPGRRDHRDAAALRGAAAAGATGARRPALDAMASVARSSARRSTRPAVMRG